MSGAVLIGILGCGRAAERLHVPALARLPDARLTAAYDPRPERRDLIARAAPGCRAFASAEALLAARVVDAVIVASPPETHAELAILTLRAGLPVLVEKPLAPSLEEASWLRAEERAARVPVMVGFNRRWWEPAETLRRTLALAQEDAAASVETTIVSDLDGWGAVSSPLDPLDDLAVHHFDLLRYLLDREIATVRAHRDAAREISLELTFHGGGSASCRAGFGGRSEERLAIGTKGRRYAIRAGSERHWPSEGPIRRTMDLADTVGRRLLGRRGGLTRSYERQMVAFVAAVRGNAPASPGTTDGIAALQATKAARLSLEHGGAEVEIPPTPTT
jgi:myo-inositol 2-dehydrogenase/D-chiro-inositol 1-dehydrogenase